MQWTFFPFRAKLAGLNDQTRAALWVVACLGILFLPSSFLLFSDDQLLADVYPVPILRHIAYQNEVGAQNYKDFFLQKLVSRSVHPGRRDTVIQYRGRLIQVFEIVGHQLHNFICEILPCSFKVRVFWIVSVLGKCCSWRVGRCSKF